MLDIDKEYIVGFISKPIKCSDFIRLYTALDCNNLVSLIFKIYDSLFLFLISDTLSINMLFSLCVYNNFFCSVFVSNILSFIDSMTFITLYKLISSILLNESNNSSVFLFSIFLLRSISVFIPAIKNEPVPQHESKKTSSEAIGISSVKSVVMWCGVKTIPFFTFETPAYLKNSS